MLPQDKSDYSELVQAIRKDAYYKRQARQEKMFNAVAIGVCVLAIFYFVGRTFITFYPTLF